MRRAAQVKTCAGSSAGAVAALGVVAALGNRNAPVAVINARERARNLRRGVDLLERFVAMLTKLVDP